LAFFIGDLTVDPLVHGFVYLACVFVGHFRLDVHFQEVVNGGLKLCLNKPKLFIYFVSEDFAEDGDVVVL
jgi:hypothetical protein